MSDHDCFWRREAHLLTEERDAAVRVVRAAALGYMSHDRKTDRYEVAGASVRKLSEALRAYADLNKAEPK